MGKLAIRLTALCCAVLLALPLAAQQKAAETTSVNAKLDDLVTKGVGYETTVQRFTVPGFTCPMGTCERWLHFTVHMAEFQESGLQEVRFRTFVNTPDGNKMHASTNWQVYINNGRPMSDVSRFPFLRNKGWYGDNPLAGYCEAGLLPPIPNAPISGIWMPTVRIVTHSTDASFPVTSHTVALDPDFHAEPPIPGTVLRQGAGMRITGQAL